MISMIEKDTVRLLRECDAGVKMGTASIDQVLKYVRADVLRELLSDGKLEHERLNTQIQERLARFQDEGKDPNPLAQRMSSVMTGVKLTMNESDHTIADLMTDGCDMGVKSLSRYLNEYKAADEVSKDIAKKLIALESKMSEDLRSFL